MEKSTIQPSPIKFGLAVKILSIIAFICIPFRFIGWYIVSPNGYDSYELYFTPIHKWEIYDLVVLLLTMIPCLLSILYAFIYHKKPRGNVIIPIILGFFVCSSIFTGIFYEEFGYTAKWTIGNWGGPTLFSLLSGMILAFLLLAIIFHLAKPKIKIFKEIAMLLAISFELVLLIVGCYCMARYGISIYWLADTISAIGFISLYNALIILDLPDRIKKPKVKKVKPLTPEQALRSLKNAFESGTITEEEYNLQRSEIINKL